jgi:sugar/nucleoside kinase (ribokinase family)
LSTSRQPLDVIVCGNLVADIIGRPIDLKQGICPGSLTLVDEIQLFTGGLGCNLSIDLARLGCKVGLVAICGDDQWKDLFLSTLQREGVDTTEIMIDPQHGSSATMICVEPSGERTFFHVIGAQQTLTANQLLERLDYISSAKVFALGYYSMMPALEPNLPDLLKTFKEKTDIKILLDTAGSVRPTLPDLSRSLSYIDFFIPSYDEAKVLTNETEPSAMVNAFRRAGASGIVGIKLGKEGCYLTNGNESVTVSAFNVERVVDTTGAGDSFLAGIIVSYLKGMSLCDMGRFANVIGACCVQAIGASSGIKNFEETARLMNEAG